MKEKNVMAENRKKAYVTFGMLWTCYGHQTVELPDSIDPNDKEAVLKYIESIWDDESIYDIPLPDGDYVPGSDVLDTEYLKTFIRKY